MTLLLRCIEISFLLLGLKKLCLDMSSHYEKVLSTWNLAKPFRGFSGREYKSRSRKEAYVNLTIRAQFSLDDAMKSSDREYFLRTHNLPYRKIETQDLVQSNDELIVIRGIAGIGKTSFIDTFVLKWIEGEILKDVDYVIKLACRELNRMTDVHSLEILLRQKFPHIFQNRSYRDLSEISEKVLIILDGFDELKDHRDFLTLTKGKQVNPSMISVLYELIRPRSANLPNKRVIVCGRPQACDVITKSFGDVIQIKLVEISGFDEKNVGIYINKYFEGKTDMIKRAKIKIAESESLKSMSKIPVFLYIMCNIFESEMHFEHINTMTKLYIAACLVFLREHARENDGKDLRDCTLMDICQDEDVLETVRQLAAFSYQSLKFKRIIFPEKDFEHISCMKAIEKSGMIEKLEGGEEGKVFQFTHLVLEEFLAALHIFLKGKNINKLHEIDNMRNCLPIVAGLEGLMDPTCIAPEYIKEFINNLCKTTEIPTVISLCTEKYLNDDIDFEMFLSIFHEYQQDICSTLKQELAVQPYLTFRLKFHHVLRNFLYFLNRVDIGIEGIIIELNDGAMTLAEATNIAPYVAKSERTAIVENVHLISRLFAYIHRKFVITLKKLKTLQINKERMKIC